MKYTLLRMVQLILMSLDSDDVSSYDETDESLQVANIIETAYNDIISDITLPENKGTFELTPSGSSSLPVVMYKPDHVTSLDWLKYNHADSGDAPNYTLLKYMEPIAFFDMTHRYNTDDPNVSSSQLTIKGDTSEIIYRTDRYPQFYTVLQDNTLVFESYDSSEESTLQNDKSMGYGNLESTWTYSNSFVPNLDSRQFSLLLNHAKRLAFVELKQVDHVVAAQNARRGLISAQKQKSNLEGNKNQLNRVNFGRKR